MEPVIVTPYMLDGFIIISLDNKWMNIFGMMPSFSVFIDKYEKLNIVSEESCLRQ